MQGTGLVAQAFGPGLAGYVISIVGTALGFGFDALTFVFTAVLTLFVKQPPKPASSTDLQSTKPSIWADIADGLRYVRDRHTLLTVLLVSAALNFFFAGPISLGTAKLAADRFTEGATALGIMGSGFGIGSLLGMVLASILKPRRFGLIIMFNVACAGIGLAVYGLVPTVLVAGLLSIAIGIMLGFTNILAISWLQKQIAPEMMGRVMSLVMLAGFGLVPISSALAGVLVQANLVLMFGISGACVFLISLLTLFDAEIRNMTN